MIVVNVIQKIIPKKYYFDESTDYGKSNLFCLYKFNNDYSSALYKIKTIFNGKFTSNSNRVFQ